MYETQVIEIWQLISSMFLLKVKKKKSNYFSQCISLFKEICLNILILQYILGNKIMFSVHLIFPLSFHRACGLFKRIFHI